jgi:hypothetical protein
MMASAASKLSGAAALTAIAVDPATQRRGLDASGGALRRRLELAIIACKVLLCIFNSAGLATAILSAETVYFYRTFTRAQRPRDFPASAPDVLKT